jgi:4-hydroxy-2-oxoheptanedioate aldolase
MLINAVKKMLAEGRPAMGGVCGTGSPLAAELMALAGLDFVMIDDQHGIWQPEAMMAAFHNIRLAGAEPMGRVQKNDFALINAMLDRGATGVIVPMVNSVADAQAAAYAMRFPPRGGRSFGPYGCAIYGDDYAGWINEQVFLAVQIESKEAIADIEGIMGVDGVDGCWIGPNDLARSMGVALWSEPHWAAIQKTLEACKRLGKVPGIALGDMPRLLAQGFLFVTPCDDFTALRTHVQSTLRALRR